MPRGAYPLPLEHREAWGRRLRAVRAVRGLSQGQLAGLSGRSQQLISHIEAGDRDAGVADGTKIVLAEALGVRPNDLFSLDPSDEWISIEELLANGRRRR